MEHRFFFSAAPASVDRKAGVIRGASLITEGEVEGHGIYVDNKLVPMFADGTLVQQVCSCLNAVPGGVLCNDEHWNSGLVSKVGPWSNGRVDNKQCRADLAVFNSFAEREKLFEMAEKTPHAFGVSVVFKGDPEIRDGKAFARCAELLRADLVDEPAANSGLFSSARPAGGNSPAPAAAHFDTGGTGNNMSTPATPTPIAQLPSPAAAPAAEPAKVVSFEEFSALRNKVEELSARLATPAPAPTPIAQLPSPAAPAPAAPEKLSAAQIEAIRKEAGEAVVQKLSKCGLTPDKLPAASADTTAPALTIKEHYEELSKLPPRDKAAYFRANIAPLENPSR